MDSCLSSQHGTVFYAPLWRHFAARDIHYGQVDAGPGTLSVAGRQLGSAMRAFGPVCSKIQVFNTPFTAAYLQVLMSTLIVCLPCLVSELALMAKEESAEYLEG